jgi:PadR family transcriptional regulator, regulatory protein AphA
MNIRFAILGFLSWKPVSGYDLKKMFTDSVFIYWSGNNNQIYKELIQLTREGMVTNEIENQESGPSKKVYTITKKGLSELKTLIQLSPEQPQIRNSFLIQLAWADILKPDELNSLLEKYENEVYMQSQMHKERKRRGIPGPARTKRESYLWDMIQENFISYYENELTWVLKLKKEIVRK